MARVRGGRRKGAGRPAAVDPRITRSISMPARFWAWLDERPGSRGQQVEGLIVDVMRQPPPERAEAMSHEEHMDWYARQSRRQAAHDADTARRATLEQRLEELRAEADAICDLLREQMDAGKRRLAALQAARAAGETL